MTPEFSARLISPIPPGFVQVTHEQFYAALRADSRDIMPTTNSETFSDWEVVGSRAVWGRSFPGWKNPGDDKAYFLAPAGERR